MSLPYQILTVAAVVLGTMATRFLPFLIFPAKRKPPEFIERLGAVLPYAVIGMLIVYCLKDVQLLAGSHGLPELLGICAVIALHLWKKNFLLSMAGGTVAYMLLVQLVF